MGKSADKRAKQLGKSVDGRPHKTDQDRPTGKSPYAQKQGRSAAYLEELLDQASTTASPVAAPATSTTKPSAWAALDAVIAEDRAHGGLDDHLQHSLEIDGLELEERRHSQSRPTPTIHTRTIRFSNPKDTFVYACQTAAKETDFNGYYGIRKRTFWHLMKQSLENPDIRALLNSPDTLAETLPLELGRVLLQRAVDTNEPVTGAVSRHDFMLKSRGAAGHVLKNAVADEVEAFAHACVRNYGHYLQGGPLPSFIKTPIAQTPASLADIRTRNAFIEQCITYSHHAELPDCAEKPQRTSAFRAALRHALGNLRGIGSIDLSDALQRNRFSGKLMHEVRANALFHVRKDLNGEGGLDYASLLAKNNGISPDVQRYIEHFVANTTRSFLQERSMGKPTESLIR
jgi:hypothetical protein